MFKSIQYQYQYNTYLIVKVQVHIYDRNLNFTFNSVYKLRGLSRIFHVLYKTSYYSHTLCVNQDE